MNFIKKWAIKRELKKARTPNNDLDLLILEELKEAKKNNTMREKLLKLKMVQQIKNDQLDEMRQDVEGSDLEDVPEEAGGFEEMIGKVLIEKFLGGSGGAVGPSGIPEGLEQKAEDFGISKEQIADIKKGLLKR